MERLKQEIFERFQKYNQSQIFRFWDHLTKDQQLSLLRQADKIDMYQLSENVHALLFSDLEKKRYQSANITPIGYIQLPRDEVSLLKWNNAYQEGEFVLHKHRVAVLTAAGGQGTRLGYEGPKGTFAATPVTNKSLFQVFAEKIKYAEKKYGYSIPWFIMTSDRNHNETLAFFGKNYSFGLSNVHFIKQDLFPAINFNGKILLENQSTIAMHPDGHGGVFRALFNSGGFSILENEGIDIISYNQVDNPLVNIIDPSFIGLHVSSESEMSSRMVFKSFPEERLGVFCNVNNKLSIVEYCDYFAEKIFSKEYNYNMISRMGNAAIHILNRDFAKKIGKDSKKYPLTFHPAKKKIPTINENGISIDPEAPNGIKFEKFIFDALQYANKTIVVEGNRKEIFSPIKNAKGLDSPETCKKDQIRLFTKWMVEAGVEIPTNSFGHPPFAIEISPMFADNEKDFLKAWNDLPSKPVIGENKYIE